ncbi:MAG TPA: FlgD immunoglobulin-like domain containing protein [Candidatus Edwardsbacteria bacterium]|nr:FlgD immunoglobulin-like domain containing protein [Candidatus Edwardsbacteria bacterium]
MKKNVRPVLLLGLALLCLAALAADGWGASPVIRNDAKGKVVKTIDANAWIIHTSNYGPFVYPYNNSPGGSWCGAAYNYIFGAGLWVGALDATDTPRVAVGYNPNSGGSALGPANPYTWDYANWATDSLSRVYLSTDAADLAQWPLRDGANEPVVLSDQDGYATYSDENPAFTPAGETPLGVRIRQSSYAWNSGPNSDIVYFKFTVINGSAGALRQVYAGPCFDADIGDESGTNANDRVDFDYTRNLAIQFQNEAEPGWPTAPGYFGCRFLASAVNNTGSVVHVTDNQFPHDIQPGEPLGMTAMKIFTIDMDPVTPTNRYLVMQGYNYNNMVLDAYDESGAVTAGDKRFVMCTGPFDLAAGDSVIISLGVIVAATRNGLLGLTDSAQIFYNSMGVAGAKPRAQTQPSRLLLSNSPNPFRGATAISYQVAEPGPVQLAIYNGLGQRVRTLVDCPQAPGRYTARWDGRDGAGQQLSAGVYIYRLQSGGRTLTRKLVLVR